MSELIIILYVLLGATMLVQVVVRWMRQRYIGAITAFLWATLVWRIAIRYAIQRGGYHLGAFGDLMANQTLVALQLFALFVTTLFVIQLEWEARR